MATVNSQQSGNWTDGATWDTGTKPASGDTVNIKEGHTVTYDEDMSGWSSGVDLTIDGVLEASTTPGDYYLLLSQNLDGSGTLRAGSDSQEYPEDCTFTLDNYRRQVRDVEVQLHAHNPTHRYVRATQDWSYNDDTVYVDADVSGDWEPGNRVYLAGDGLRKSRIVDSIASDSIKFTETVGTSGSVGDYLMVLDRNVVVYDSYCCGPYGGLFVDIAGGSVVNAQILGSGTSSPSAVYGHSTTPDTPVVFDGTMYNIGNLYNGSQTFQRAELFQVKSIVTYCSYPVQGARLMPESIVTVPVGKCILEGLRVGCTGGEEGASDDCFIRGGTIDRVGYGLKGNNIIAQGGTVTDKCTYGSGGAWGFDLRDVRFGAHFYGASGEIHGITFTTPSAEGWDVRTQEQQVKVYDLHTYNGDGIPELPALWGMGGAGEGPWVKIYGIDGDPEKVAITSPAGKLLPSHQKTSPLRTDWSFHFTYDTLEHNYAINGHGERAWYDMDLRIDSSLHMTFYTTSYSTDDVELLVSLMDFTGTVVKQQSIVVPSTQDTWESVDIDWTDLAPGPYRLMLETAGDLFLDWEFRDAAPVYQVTNLYMPFQSIVGQDQVSQTIECKWDE